MSNLTIIKQTLAAPQALAQFKLALPAHISAEKFQRVALTALMQSPQIADCTKESVLNSLMKCAQDGLLPDGREAALVQYRGKSGVVAQYMPMVYGVIKRMKNSGEVADVNAHSIYSGDKFEYQILDGVSKVSHTPAMFSNRGQFIGVYAVIRFRDGENHIEVMTKDECDKIRQRSKAKDSGPWVTDYEEMCKKTVIRRAAKRVPTSSEIERLLQQDLRVSMGVEDEPEEANPSLVDSINEAIASEPEVIEGETVTEEEGHI
jgi:recombination protein RecT